MTTEHQGLSPQARRALCRMSERLAINQESRYLLELKSQYEQVIKNLLEQDQQLRRTG